MHKNKLVVLGLIFFYSISNILADAEGFGIKFKNCETVYFNRFFQTVMPGNTVEFNVEAENQENIEVYAEKGNIKKMGGGKWIYTAPENSGDDQLAISNKVSNQSIVITIFVLAPLNKMKGEYLNGYRIGLYPDEGYKGQSKYKKPEGLIEVTGENKDIFITPHFQLKQFLCKQESEWPKYLLLNPKLLVKLEFLISELHKEKVNVKTLFIMSGYRTPYYNKSIGNVKNSRHVYGDAADIYVDENNDGVIDDLNKDNKHTMSDAEVLHEIVSRYDNDPDYEHLMGGLGKYNKNSAHTFFIHVDTRGYKARW
ncbi:MAG: hypothetical protein DRJ05_17645 [Bacteroidetes bacterium]|nr:MAG: hypothetical protein DRJ05_17645 [Bacteroidota bacterium]